MPAAIRRKNIVVVRCPKFAKRECESDAFASKAVKPTAFFQIY
jgi:hypothetical protein